MNNCFTISLKGIVLCFNCRRDIQIKLIKEYPTVALSSRIEYPSNAKCDICGKISLKEEKSNDK